MTAQLLRGHAAAPAAAQPLPQQQPPHQQQATAPQPAAPAPAATLGQPLQSAAQFPTGGAAGAPAPTPLAQLIAMDFAQAAAEAALAAWGDDVSQAVAALVVQLQVAEPEPELPPIPRSPVFGRTLITTNFKVAYGDADVPGILDFGGILEDLIRGYCTKDGIPWKEEGLPFLKLLQAELLSAAITVRKPVTFYSLFYRF